MQPNDLDQGPKGQTLKRSMGYNFISLPSSQNVTTYVTPVNYASIKETQSFELVAFFCFPFSEPNSVCVASLLEMGRVTDQLSSSPRHLFFHTIGIYARFCSCFI